MPIFDYKCTERDCVMYAHPQEVLVSNRNDIVECFNPDCKKPMMLIITAPSYFHLKGSWPGKDIKRGVK